MHSPASQLPIYNVAGDIGDRLRACPRLVLQAPTGSGKSTQVPQMLLAQGRVGEGQIVVLQPRRLAARLLAARVARERGVELGGEVGYQVRFENCVGPTTRIRYATEGVVLRQMIQDPHLTGVSALILDEFHERHLYGDITLARALDLQAQSRPDLLVVVMSATLESNALAEYLRPCGVVQAEGRQFPVEIEYLAHRLGPQSPPVWELAAEAFGRHVRGGCGGDVLVFMPGGYEIAQTLEAIRHRAESKDYLLLPLHGDLAPADQDAAVARYERPKVVVSTNVAETSVTIEGVSLVIDSGLARIPRYDPHRGINTLLIEKISQASAEQRAGRAGRTGPGRCMRLWSEPEHQERPAHQLPEVRRLDLAEVVLTLKAAGLEDLRQFRWLEPPAEQGLRDAEVLLTDLGALDRAGRITEIGRRMLAFPVHPRYGRMLLAAREYGCVYQAALMAALTQGRDLLLRNVGRDVEGRREDLFGGRGLSDLWVLMRAWSYAAKNDFRLEACRRLGIHAQTARQVQPLLQQFLLIAERQGLETTPKSVPDQALQKCVLAGFSDRVARRLDQGTLRCELVHGRRGVLARESVVQDHPLLVAAEVREVGSSDRSVQTLLSLATAVEADWLRQLFPEDWQLRERVFFDPATKRVCAEAAECFRELSLSTRRIEPPPTAAAARILAEEVIAGRLTLKHWDHAVDQWILRLNLLGRWCPELELPPLSEADRRTLIEHICLGGFSYKDVKEREVRTAVRGWVPAAQQELVERHAPERLTLANGRRPKVSYAADGPPYVALRIQELYDVAAAPRIAMNRVPVLVHILAPSMRPVQITQDLANFWREHYPRLKQELQRRYPKHQWR
ncbi:MAG: ATP-dependent helicase HrpB [Verrucomicrobia bacterium]|nr:ATP-dependent helicase HrpB [Verrucomicrobiota bacterium]